MKTVEEVVVNDPFNPVQLDAPEDDEPWQGKELNMRTEAGRRYRSGIGVPHPNTYITAEDLERAIYRVTCKHRVVM